MFIFQNIFLFFGLACPAGRQVCHTQGCAPTAIGISGTLQL